MRNMLIAAAISIAVSPALAADDGCAAKPKLVTYFAPTKLPDSGTRCTMAKGKCVEIELRGYLYTPKGPGKHPILIYNHGSEETPGEKCAIGTYFSNLGYFVFVPHRRGHGHSTGAYLDAYTKDFCSQKNDPGFCKMEYLHKQVDDVEEAIAFMKKQPGAAAERIALMGHSFGGITTVFANTKDLGQRAVVNASGASQSWEGNDDARKEMDDAVRAAVAPTFFLEPLNDRSIDPTLDLAHAAGEACRQFQSAIFQAIDATGDGKVNAADYATVELRDKAHGQFSAQVSVWGPAAHEFMQRYLDKPAAKFDKHCRGTSHSTN
jgi:dienelactone hydrolase